MAEGDVLKLYRRLCRNEAEAKVEALRKTAAEIGYAIVRADEYNAMRRMAATRAAIATRSRGRPQKADAAPVDAEA